MAVVKVSRSVEELLETLGLSGVALQARIAALWHGAVGPLIAGKTFPARLKAGVLTVHVLNHAWAQELTLAAPTLLAKLGKAAGEGTVRDIRFRVGPLPGADDAAPERDEEHPPPPGEDPPDLSGVPDPETREILLSLSRRAAARLARDPAARSPAGSANDPREPAHRREGRTGEEPPRKRGG